ncbi:MAG: hypothetical protein M3162_08725 [Thermoproteota archaeon]|nr:hypothetical protein [Thermoproteota archaeon]
MRFICINNNLCGVTGKIIQSILQSLTETILQYGNTEIGDKVCSRKEMSNFKVSVSLIFAE